MLKKETRTDILHKTPEDLRKILASDRETQKAWESITPLARNEWICWVISVRKQETRDKHIKRMKEDLKKGKHRPCCWAGCMHR